MSKYKSVLEMVWKTSDSLWFKIKYTVIHILNKLRKRGCDE